MLNFIEFTINLAQKRAKPTACALIRHKTATERYAVFFGLPPRFFAVGGVTDAGAAGTPAS